jgi:tetratricopeptide (TPR) repeat protein
VSEQIKILDSKNIKTRLIIVFAVILALIFGWYSIRWQLGNMLADLSQPNDQNAKSVAAIAVAFAPSDPIANFFAASAETDFFSPEKLEKSIARYERVVRLAPFDFRWWIQLGRAYEQAEKNEQAEKALLHAVELAPNYTFPHWQIGNFYLRRGRETEAFAALKKAADNNPVYREQVFSIAWDFYDKDTARLEQIVGNSSDARAGLAKFYAAKERAEDSVRVWETLTPEEKQKHEEIAKLIAQALYDKRFFRSSVKFVSELGIEPNAKPEAVENPGFETGLRGNDEKVFFGWRVVPTEKVKVDRDRNQRREGAYGLRVLFTGFANVELYNLSQIVAVAPASRYRVSFAVKTENLKSAGTPTLEIVNAADNRIIAVSKAFPNDTNDWQQIQTEFTMPAGAEGVILRLARSYCGENCLITGTIWLDDFKLEKLK